MLPTAFLSTTKTPENPNGTQHDKTRSKNSRPDPPACTATAEDYTASRPASLLATYKISTLTSTWRPQARGLHGITGPRRTTSGSECENAYAGAPVVEETRIQTDRYHALETKSDTGGCTRKYTADHCGGLHVISLQQSSVWRSERMKI